MDMNAGNNFRIIATFIYGLRILKRSLEVQYAMESTKKVEIRHTKQAIINVFLNICGKSRFCVSVNSRA